MVRLYDKVLLSFGGFLAAYSSDRTHPPIDISIYRAAGFTVAAQRGNLTPLPCEYVVWCE